MTSLDESPAGQLYIRDPRSQYAHAQYEPRVAPPDIRASIYAQRDFSGQFM